MILAAILLCTLFPAEAKADGGILENSTWEYIFQTEAGIRGLIQSVCVTDDYIITIENTGDSSDMADIVTAYYKNDYDRNGNPVQRYSVANTVASEEWEHGNGMCYNPKTNEIYVALYTNTIPENRGCIYVMDPDTLTKKGSVKILEDCNILAIEYDALNDIYYIQTNADRAYSLMILDSNFQVIQDLGAEPADPGYNFQDFCVEGDFILQFPLTWGMGIGEYMMAYSLSQGAVVNVIQLFFDELHEKYIEPESIAKLDDTTFIVPVNATTEDNIRRCVFYRVHFPNLPLVQTASGTEGASAEASSASAASQVSGASQTSGISSASGASSASGISSASGMSQSAETQSASSPQIAGTSSVSSTSVMSIPVEVSVKKGNTPLTAVPEKTETHFPKAAVIIIIVLAAAAAAGVFYTRYIRAERAKREERMRSRRRVALARMAVESDEKEFDRMLYRDFANLYDLESLEDE